MVIDQKRGFVFIHNPKAAGQAMTQALGGKQGRFHLHCPLRAIDRGRLFAFGIVRNPWSRMVSLYRFLCYKTFRRTDNFDQEAVRKMGFERWLLHDRFFLQQDDRSIAWEPMQRRSQVFWLEGADEILRFEHLEEDARALFGRLQIPWKGLRVVNANPPQVDWRGFFTEELDAHIRHYFGWEIEAFGYGR